jgi:hypothetical protein
MSNRGSTIFKHGRARQRGAALLIILVILLVGIAAVLINSLTAAAAKNARQEKTAAALAQAKDALLGRAVSDNTMPGSLPCPDTNDDGSAELLSGNDCPSYIGRLPWKTLGLPELRDGNGEHLWYALSPAFRDDSSAQPLNSNTKGTLLVYNADGATLLTQPGYSAVAVIFAPGSPVGSQVRNTLAQQNDPANYLDTANSQNNATAGGPFITGAETNTFNDQLMIITTQNLIPLVEQRVAGEVKKALTNYYTAYNYYPWPDDMTVSADYDSNAGINRGWLPYHSSTPTSAEWCCTAFPAWFYNNQWYTLIYYSVAEYYTADRYDFGCYTCKLTVDSTGGVQVLFFMPGTPIGTLTRSLTSLPDYLEDSANNDNSNDLYVTPASNNEDRDRLYWLSSSSNWNQ